MNFYVNMHRFKYHIIFYCFYLRQNIFLFVQANIQRLHRSGMYLPEKYPGCGRIITSKIPQDIYWANVFSLTTMDYIILVGFDRRCRK